MIQILNHVKIYDARNRMLFVKLGRKGNVNECKKLRGITLLPLVGKIQGSIT